MQPPNPLSEKEKADISAGLSSEAPPAAQFATGRFSSQWIKIFII